MGLVTLLAVFLLGSGAADAGPETGAPAPPASGSGVDVDTSAVAPPLRVKSGSLDATRVREVVTAQRDALRSCYEGGLAETPSLSGACTVRMVVDRDGTVVLASMNGSSLRSLSMQRCVLQLARTWRFPPTADGKAAAIEYPLAFRRFASDAGQ